jgi:hypothetical protein
MTDHATTYQLGWYLKRTPGPGRRALVGSEMFQHDQFDAVIAKTKSLLDEGFEVRILPLPTVKP